MKIYYYAYTGHKYGLDRARRAIGVLKRLREEGFDTMLLVNDFRAGLAVKELGIPESINIEGIQDIDAVAQIGDVVIIDSPEDDHGRLVKYCSDFKQVFRFAEHEDDKSIHGEIMLTIDCKDEDESCISSLIVDDVYCQEYKKEKRTLFFLGDSDADKTILKNSDFFRKNKMELLLGHYFYVKYESDLENLFIKLHEPEEYVDLICSSSCVVTSSFQTALEAYATGAKVIFIEIERLNTKQKELLELFNIIIIIDFDNNCYNKKLSETKENPIDYRCVNIEKNRNIIKKLIDKYESL